MRGARATARFLVAFCIGVVATLAWQSYSDAARQLIATSQFGGSAPHVAQIAKTTPEVVAPAASAFPPPDQQHPAAIRQSVDQLAATQEQINRSVVQLASAQEQMMRDITRLQEAGRSTLSKVSVPLPRPAPVQARMRPARPTTTAGAGTNARHAATSSTSVGSSSPLPALLTRLDTGHKRTQSSGADLRSSTPPDPFSQVLMSALSRITGIRL
jgi:hypothetical protein